MVLVFLTLMELFAPEADGCLTYGLWILEGDLYRVGKIWAERKIRVFLCCCCKIVSGRRIGYMLEVGVTMISAPFMINAWKVLAICL